MAGCPQEPGFNGQAQVGEFLGFERVIGIYPHLLIKL